MTVHTRLCAACGAIAARVEVVAPGQQPEALADWPASRQSLYGMLAGGDQWRLIVDSVDGSNGPAGEEIVEVQASTINDMLDPFDAIRVSARFSDRLGQCLVCDKAYCSDCWGGNAHGRCPQGHPAAANPVEELPPTAEPAEVEPEAPAGGVVLAEVRRAHLAVQEAEHALRLAVRAALSDGASWQNIAASIDSSEHAARERFEYLVPGALGIPDLPEELQ